MPEEAPWMRTDLPGFGEVIVAEVRFLQGSHYICRTDEDLEVLLPREEVDLSLLEGDNSSLSGCRYELLVIEVDEETGRIKASLERLDEDPWAVIHSELPRGTELRGEVLEVTPDYLSVKLPNKLTGYIPRQYVEEAGYDYASYVESIAPGVRISMVVSKVFINRHKIRLTLCQRD